MVPFAITNSANCQVIEYDASQIARILCCPCILTKYSHKLDAHTERLFNQPTKNQLTNQPTSHQASQAGSHSPPNLCIQKFTHPPLNFRFQNWMLHHSFATFECCILLCTLYLSLPLPPLFLFSLFLILHRIWFSMPVWLDYNSLKWNLKCLSSYL